MIGSDAGGWVAVEVPATSANLGPGFDSLGLALALHDYVQARFTSDSTVRVEVAGEGAADVPDDEDNLVARVVRVGLATFDTSGELARRGLEIRCQNSIPHSRGLGSSAAAIVAGLAVAAALVAHSREGRGTGDPPSAAQLVAMATWLEGHPDNVAAAVLGGGTVSWLVPGPRETAADAVPTQHRETTDVGRATRIAVHPAITPVLVIPPGSSSTSRARAALPESVAHADAAFNAGRAALLVHALTAEPRLLMPATEDRLHQQQRREQYPASLSLVEALRARGIPAAISGAGPSVIALAADLPGCVPVHQAVELARQSAEPAARVEVLPVAPEGVRADQSAGIEPAVHPRHAETGA